MNALVLNNGLTCFINQLTVHLTISSINYYTLVNIFSETLRLLSYIFIAI